MKCWTSCWQSSLSYKFKKFQIIKPFTMFVASILCSWKIFTKFRWKVIFVVLLSLLFCIYVLNRRTQLTVRKYAQTTGIVKSPPIVIEIVGGNGKKILIWLSHSSKFCFNWPKDWAINFFSIRQHIPLPKNVIPTFTSV